MPDSVVISQDELVEIHVGPPAGSVRRLLEIRLWRRGLSGFSPSGTGLLLQPMDTDALREALTELMNMSNGGNQVARVVYDVDQGRRLRAEIEPFGAHFVARLGFWQRVRDTWRPADDGLVVAAARVRQLQQALDRFRSWVHATPVEDTGAEAVLQRESLKRWPSPGADWLTSEPNRVAFHPKGFRITFTVMEQDSRHWLDVRQWRREDTLWTPEKMSVPLSVNDLDLLAACLARLLEEDWESAGPQEFGCQDESAVRLMIDGGAKKETLRIAWRSPELDGWHAAFEQRLSIPLEFVPRFGRAVAQGWSMLLGWLSDDERTERQTRERRAGPSGSDEPEPETGPSNESAKQLQETQELQLDLPPRLETAPNLDSMPEIELLPGQVFPFGAESETPGTVIPRAGAIQIMIEGFPSPRIVTLPLENLEPVVKGLEDMETLRARRPRIDPVLLCDRPDCAVYARVGTPARPDVMELRIWTGPTASDSITFETIYLRDLLEGVHSAALLLGEPLAPARGALEVENHTPSPLPAAHAPARSRPFAATRPLTVPGPIATLGGGIEQAVPAPVDLGQIRLGEQRVSLKLHGYLHHRSLALEWDEQYFELPVDGLGQLLVDLRTLYYDAVRGRRGRTLSIGEYPVVTVTVRNKGASLQLWMQQEIDGEITALTFPANEVPLLLDAAQAALTTA